MSVRLFLNYNLYGACIAMTITCCIDMAWVVNTTEGITALRWYGPGHDCRTRFFPYSGRTIRPTLQPLAREVPVHRRSSGMGRRPGPQAFSQNPPPIGAHHLPIAIGSLETPSYEPPRPPPSPNTSSKASSMAFGSASKETAIAGKQNVTFDQHMNTQQ